MTTKVADPFAKMILHDQATALVSVLNAMILSTLNEADADVSLLRSIRDNVRAYKRSVAQDTTTEALEDWSDDLRSHDDE